MRIAQLVLSLSLFLASCCAAAQPMPMQPLPPQPLPVAPAPASPLGRWSELHPDAAKALSAWMNRFTPPAAWMFQWDAAHPEGTQELIAWALRYPAQGVSSFIEMHPAWGAFDEFAQNHREAVLGFLIWCRQFPQAAELLANHPGGLGWVGRHLGASGEQPGRPGY